MSSLMRWDPFTVIEPLSDAMDRFFTDGLAPTRRGSLFEMDAARALAAMDMYETDDAVVVTVAVPGVAPEDVQVSVVGDTLTIRGEIKTNDQAEKGRYLCRDAPAAVRARQLPGWWRRQGAGRVRARHFHRPRAQDQSASPRRSRSRRDAAPRPSGSAPEN